MRIFVVSNVESRRTEYFIEAGKSLGADPRFLSYAELTACLPALRRTVVKLEPFVYNEAGVAAYARLCAAGRRVLERLEKTDKAGDVRFLNNPGAILQALDKVRCKERLEAAGLPVTPLLTADAADFESLVSAIASCRRGVFLKPRYGSGAEGIMAIRYQAQQGRWVAYTTLQRLGACVYNTKRIHRLTDVAEIGRLAQPVLEAGALAEEWIPKESAGGLTYDLRVVCCGGRADYVVVRYSRGTITNLHLNNRAGRFAELGLPEELGKEIFRLCVAATQAAGLYYAGVDVLLEKGSRCPRIIEVNGQGDHIYQDMFEGNCIYRHQIESVLTAGSAAEENRQ